MGKESEPQPAPNLQTENSIEKPINRPGEKPILLGKGDSVRALPSEATIVHIARYPTTTLIKEVLETCPKLEVAQLTPFRYNLLMRPKAAAARLLEKNDIEIRKAFFSPRKGKSIIDKKKDLFWEERRVFLTIQAPLGAEKRLILERAREMGFVEAEMVFRYFCLDEPRPPRISFLNLGMEYGCSNSVARLRVMAVLHGLGFPCQERAVHYASLAFKKKYDKAHEEKRKRRKLAKKKALYEKFQPLPPGLPPSQWEDFLALTKIKAQSPEEFASLPEQTQLILNLYFGLDNGVYRSDKKVVKVLGSNITRWGIYHIKSKGLQQLGIKEKKRKKQTIKIESLKRCHHGLVEDWCGECNPPDLDLEE